MALNRIILYALDVEQTVAFYEKFFGFKASREAGDRIVELVPANGGARLMIHQAGRAQKAGQSQVKLVFDVEDVEGFCALAAKNGLVFSALHQGEGYVFANARDPARNSISVSSRAFRESRR
ncbi:VOC family protein [Taklimakanibacter lacteus]|uniref:VOC family protein n=1 Tax=Taklimakanibacter lacteus TaxID=2268456 RepID=UPI000E67521E